MKTQRGFSLLEVLVALVILTFGLLGIAKAYLMAIPAVTQNQQVTQANTAADAFWGLTQLQSGTPSSFDATQVAQVPAYLDGWMQQYERVLPNFEASLQTGADTLGQSCSANSCAMNLTLAWSDHGVRRAQTYHYQKGY